MQKRAVFHLSRSESRYSEADSSVGAKAQSPHYGWSSSSERIRHCHARLLIRHLVMPGGLAGTREIMTFLADNLSVESYVNIMPQYRPPPLP